LIKLCLITRYHVYGILTKLEQIAITSLIFSLIAMGLSLVRILKSHRESKRKREANLFSNITNITKMLDDEKFVQSRRAVRKNKLLNQLKEGNGNDNLIFEIDLATEEATKNVATTYDRLGFILKHDKELEDEFLQWQSYVILDMWLLTKDLVTKKWRTRNKTNLKEFERISNKALDNEHMN
jgi:hypothetical protein